MVIILYFLTILLIAVLFAIPIVLLFWLIRKPKWLKIEFFFAYMPVLVRLVFELFVAKGKNLNIFFELPLAGILGGLIIYLSTVLRPRRRKKKKLLRLIIMTFIAVIITAVVFFLAPPIYK